MLVYAGPNSRPVPGDILLRAVLRSDLTPIPQTVEVTVRDDPEFASYWAQGAKINVGRDGAQFTIIKTGQGELSGQIQGPRQFATVKVTGLLSSCAGIASPLQRAVIREGATLGGIYRACGAQARIDQDFVVPRFCAFVGDVPSVPIAVALQEEAAAMTFKSGKLTFRRLADLASQKPVVEVAEATQTTEASRFKEEHAVPFAYSAADDGSVVYGRRESGRRAMYWPRTDERILRNLSAVLIQRRTLQSEFAPDLMAGDVMRVGSTNFVIITAAHVWDTDSSTPTQYSKLWLGEFVQ